MRCGELCVVVPFAAEALLVCLCVLVWLRLRELEVNGVCQWTLAAVGLDTVTQGWQLWLRAGRPAGVAWLLHAALSFTMVYILYRLGELLAHLRLSRRVGEGGVAALEGMNQGRG